jgi:hypothetical protein
MTACFVYMVPTARLHGSRARDFHRRWTDQHFERQSFLERHNSLGWFGGELPTNRHAANTGQRLGRTHLSVQAQAVCEERLVWRIVR